MDKSTCLNQRTDSVRLFHCICVVESRINCNYMLGHLSMNSKHSFHGMLLMDLNQLHLLCSLGITASTQCKSHLILNIKKQYNYYL